MNHPTLMNELATSRVADLRTSALAAGSARRVQAADAPRRRRRLVQLRPAFGR
jgi:hypothetical protein